MSFYLLEVGCEELPASSVKIAADYVRQEMKRLLDTNMVNYTTLTADATPRRIFVYLDGLSDKQADREEVIQGPPAKLAFNPDGTVSEMGLKFARSRELDENTLTRVATAKGDYLSGKKLIRGKETKPLMKDYAEHLIKTIPFSKTMRWGDNEFRFARPLKYLFSLYNGEKLTLEISGIRTTDKVAGHRFLAPGPFKVADYTIYEETLCRAKVMKSTEERKRAVLAGIEQICAEKGYQADTDEALLETVANLVEFPYAVLGSYSEKFLELPAPVLITSMKHHQKYFPLYDKNGLLLAKFIGISNMPPSSEEYVRLGYERVLVARLNDALFFFENDKKTPLEARLEMLKKVVYQEKLGTSYEKVQRVKKLAVHIATQVAAPVADVERASTLAKADLMCEMVYEFPELQGYMGRIYAILQGESPVVAAAIEEHYMPRYAGGELPKTLTGKVLALADKIETMAGAFAVGLIPSGNEDPYALRRAAIGIISIVEDTGWRLDIKDLFKRALVEVIDKALYPQEEILEKLFSFFITRHKQLLLSRGEIEIDAYEAAVAKFKDIISQRDKALVLTKAKVTDTFTSIAASYKRINNILKKAEEDGAFEEALFEHEEEKALYKLYLEKKVQIEVFVAEEKWQSAVAELSSLAPALAAYFDKVMVMATDLKLRGSRLNFLKQLKALFNTVGDLSLIS